MISPKERLLTPPFSYHVYPARSLPEEHRAGLTDFVQKVRGSADPSVVEDRLDLFYGGMGGDTTHLVLHDNAPVGIASIATFEANNQRSRVWELIEESSPLFASRAREISPVAAFINYIAVSPEHRRTGIATQMMKNAASHYQPSMFIGVTRAPKQALARSLALPDYRTFVGDTEITPGSFSFSTDIHHPLSEPWLQVGRYPLN